MPTNPPDQLLSVGRIYSILCSLTGRYYVGQTWRTIHQRWLAHQSSARNPKSGSYNNYLCSAIREHTSAAFVIKEEATATTQEELDRLEVSIGIELGALYPEGYSKALGQRIAGRRRKFTKTAEQRKALSEAHLRAHANDPTLAEKITAHLSKDGSNWVGRKHTEDSKAKMRAAKIGKKQSPEHAAKAALARTGKKISASHRNSLLAAWEKRKTARLCPPVLDPSEIPDASPGIEESKGS